MPKAQPTCRHGHEWTEASTYLRSDGKRLCRICRARRQRDARMSVSNIRLRRIREPQRKPEAEPVSVKWWLYQTPKSMAHYTAEQAASAIVRAFTIDQGHRPTIMLVFARLLVVTIPDVTVRIAGSNEPKPTSESCFYVR